MPFDLPDFVCKDADGKELSDKEKELIAANLQVLVTTLDHLNVKEVEVLPMSSKIGARVFRLGPK